MTLSTRPTTKQTAASDINVLGLRCHDRMANYHVLTSFSPALIHARPRHPQGKDHGEFLRHAALFQDSQLGVALLPDVVSEDFLPFCMMSLQWIRGSLCSWPHWLTSTGLFRNSLSVMMISASSIGRVSGLTPRLVIRLPWIPPQSERWESSFNLLQLECSILSECQTNKSCMSDIDKSYMFSLIGGSYVEYRS